MKRKWFGLLLCFALCMSGLSPFAQQGSDTTFSFYFNSAQYRVDSTQQKEFESFLKGVQNLVAIRGFADTVGTTIFNKKLAQKRASNIHQLLPHSIQNKALITAVGETAEASALWKNRRVDVVATKKGAIDTIQPVKRDSVTQLNIDNILFLPDAPILTEASYAYVKALAQQLQQYRTQQFRIVGHVNYQSKLPAERLKDLYQLSEARAKAVYVLLVQYGIEARRMTYTGVGNSQPIYHDPINDEQKRANMRVQVLILNN